MSQDETNLSYLILNEATNSITYENNNLRDSNILYENPIPTSGINRDSFFFLGIDYEGKLVLEGFGPTKNISNSFNTGTSLVNDNQFITLKTNQIL